MRRDRTGEPVEDDDDSDLPATATPHQPTDELPPMTVAQAKATIRATLNRHKEEPCP